MADSAEDDLVERTIKAIADPIAGAIKKGRDNAVRAAVQAEHERTREACAQIADSFRAGVMAPESYEEPMRVAGHEIAAAIRAMPEQDPERGKEEG